MTTSAVQAPRVRRAATAASITHTRVEFESVFESGSESRCVRVRRSEGIVVNMSVYVCVCVFSCTLYIFW